MNFIKILDAIDKDDYTKLSSSRLYSNIFLFDHRGNKFMSIDNEPYGTAQLQYSKFNSMSCVHYDRENIPKNILISLGTNNSIKVELNDDIESKLFQLSTIYELDENTEKNVIKTYKLFKLINDTKSIDRIRITIYDYNAFFVGEKD